jgi:hypothetical protein
MGTYLDDVHAEKVAFSFIFLFDFFGIHPPWGDGARWQPMGRFTTSLYYCLSNLANVELQPRACAGVAEISILPAPCSYNVKVWKRVREMVGYGIGLRSV